MSPFGYPGALVGLKVAKICILDEPSNFLDREALGGLAVAIRDWAGAVVRLHFPFSSTVIRYDRNEVIISHNEEFVNALCECYVYVHTKYVLIVMLGPEIWNISEGRMTHKGKTAVVEDAFDFKSPRGSGSNTPARSRVQSPAASAVVTPAASGAEDKGTPGVPVVKKKKLTRNQVKAQEERRRLRKLAWLQSGGLKPEDTDED